MKKLYLFIALLLFTMNCLAQGYFNKIYRYSALDSISRTENITPVVEIQGIGYLAGGESSNYITKNGLIILYNIDYAGNVTSIVTYGDSGYFYIPKSMELTYDNNIMFLAYKAKFTVPNDSIFINLYKLDLSGSLIWYRQYSSGLVLSAPIKGIETNDHGFAILGWTGMSNNPPVKMYLLKTDSLGNKEWDMQYGDSANYIYNGFSLLQESDSGYVLLGWTGTNGTYYRMITLIRTDKFGNKLWQQDYGLPTSFAHGDLITKAKDGNYFISGMNGIPFGDANGLLIKTDTVGNIIFQKNYGFTKLGRIRGLVENSDSTICFHLGQVLSNPTQELANLYKVNANGDSIWSRQYVYDTTVVNNHCTGFSLIATSDGGYLISGQELQPSPATQDAWLVKVDSMGCEVPNCITVGLNEPERKPIEMKAYPNPFNEHCIIAINDFEHFENSFLIIENIVGERLKIFSIPFKSSKFDLHATDFSPGIYFYSIINKDTVRIASKSFSVIK